MKLDIESKMCRSCLIKIHSESGHFSLKLPVPAQFKELQMLVESLNPLPCHNYKLDRITENVDINSFNDIVKINCDNSDATPATGEKVNPTIQRNRFTASLAAGFNAKIKRAKIKQFRLNQIKYKMAIVTEQISTALQNHTNSIENGRFEDAEVFQEQFYSLWEVKIHLEENLVKMNES